MLYSEDTRLLLIVSHITLSKYTSTAINLYVGAVLNLSVEQGMEQRLLAERQGEEPLISSPTKPRHSKVHAQLNGQILYHVADHSNGSSHF